MSFRDLEYITYHSKPICKNKKYKKINQGYGEARVEKQRKVFEVQCEVFTVCDDLGLVSSACFYQVKF